MLSPGSKGWIDKYLSLVKKNEIKLICDSDCGVAGENYMHMILGATGLVFGIQTDFLFLRNLGEEKWTKHEKLKVLYFESLLLIYVESKRCKGEELDFQVFLKQLEHFFEFGGSLEVRSSWLDFLRLNQLNKLEEVIDKRTQIPLSFDHKLWISYLQNSLCFIDILLFKQFIEGTLGSSDLVNERTKMVETTLLSIILAAHADGLIEVKEKTMFDMFLASADFSDEDRGYYQDLFKHGASLKELPDTTSMSLMFRRYLLDIAIFTVWSDTDFSQKEYAFLQTFTYQLNFTSEDLNDSFSVVENFVLQNHEIIPYLKAGNSYDKVFNRLTGRWSRVILRNKDRLTKEIRESRELVELVRKSAVAELTPDEKDKVRSQFMDIIKSVPALAIFMLPGGVILLPLILKIIPNLVPSAFRDNEIDDEDK
jgi:hypothetical protein